MTFNVTIKGKRTSVRLEPEFLTALLQLARRRRRSVHWLCERAKRQQGWRESFTSRLRIYIMQQTVKDARK